ncbi:unnamed protein product [Cyprideis torosa]|uniref:Uncharacterized protein n=1 Tax=Cyprideis torosa TaxID=163714 RepID=A0A7R8W6C1_9CRUS|nr:unnamed protein product [Cyprideis torosa]CAG0886327.1 unnamed protein product [Cyprideis torosa]
MTTLIDMAMDGYSATVFCYGQTGSGKTHTLTGPPGLIQSNNFESEDHGLMFRSFVFLFGRLEKADPELNYVIRASYLEIYNEQVKDLLNPNPNQRSLAVRWNKKGFYVENLFTIECKEIDDLLAVLEEGTCISALSEPQKRKDGKKKHIPFRDSKLTKLLADSLGGNGITLMVACISPAKSNLSESLCTLRYAARAKKIKTTPIVIMDPRERLIISLKRDVALLRRENGYLKDQLGLDPDEPVKIDEEYKGPPEELINVKGEPKERPRKSRKKTLDDMDKEAMAKLLTEFMTENDALRSENMELYALRDALMRDQEIVCRENERLIQKLEYMHE